ncbi:MAG: hypothetical protein J5632_01770 [Bacteroidales bacterium]|nr:hypothetical protein [Bacteroidales bacterium]
MFKRFIIAAAAVTLACFSASAQEQNGEYTSYSPYSIFGLGDIATPGSAYNLGMGGVGLASRNNRYLNTLNPAAVTARDSLSFMLEFFINNNNSLMEQNAGGSTHRMVKNSSNIGGFAASFPIWKSSAFMAGLAPYSSTGYRYSYKETDQNILATEGNVDYLNFGQGSLYKLFLGAGATFWKKFSVGAQVDYVFGNVEKGFYQTFAKVPHNDAQDIYKMHLHAFVPKLGFQFEQAFGKKSKICVGGTFTPSVNLLGIVDYQSLSVGSAETITVVSTSDTLSHNPGRLKLPTELALGIAWRYGDKFRAEFDWTSSYWKNCGFDSYEGFGNDSALKFSACNRNVFRAGVEYIPNPTDIRYYRKRVTYRAGAYRINEYYSFCGNSVSTTGVTLGMTLPVFRWYNGLSIALDAGRRGSLDGGMVRETYFRLSFGVNLYDIWFQKPKYD